MTKVCSKCGLEKSVAEFSKYKREKDGLHSWCKECSTKARKAYRKTKKGVITDIYSNQKANSKERNHPMPTYTNMELREWLLNDWLFNLIYNNWVNCGYKKNMKPSVDRYNNDSHYNFSHQLNVMTWAENKAKAYADHKSGKLRYDQKPILQFTKNGTFIKKYLSIREAERVTGAHNAHITSVCKNKRKYAGGFIWRYKEG